MQKGITELYMKMVDNSIRNEKAGLPVQNIEREIIIEGHTCNEKHCG